MATTTASTKATAKKTAKPASGKDTVTPIGKIALTEQAATQKAAPPNATVQKPKKAVEAEKPAKPKKPKLVRDSFTIPKDEYQVIDALKQRSAKLGQPMKKSELLRAGIKLLNGLDDAAFGKAVAEVPAIKTGRPKKSKQ
ncbi:MAG TPA: hypothetical protein VFS17_03235 [Methylophilaceae bacterium]|nr:hypothetical protein [Methylophilaceae bacterium]